MADPETNGHAGDFHVEDVEATLARIPSVTAARVVSGPGGRITEVHLLAKRDRAPKQLVRDVQSVTLARFGIEVDYRTVSVVQLDEGPDGDLSPANPQAGRPSLVKVSTDVSGAGTEVRVFLDFAGREFIGSARGPAATWVRIVGRAVIDAASPLWDQAFVDLDYADVITAGDHSVAVIVLRTATVRGDRVVSGSAVAARDLHDAVARATLSGLNRLMR